MAGIENVGETCYIASCLVLLCFGMPEVAQGIVEKTHFDSEFGQQLKKVFEHLLSNQTVNPRELYDTLQDWDGNCIDTSHSGDAGSMLNWLLMQIHNLDVDCTSFEFQIQSAVFAKPKAIMEDSSEDSYSDSSESSGSCEESTDESSLDSLESCHVHSKPKTAPRILRGLFPVSVLGHSNLLSALSHSTVIPQPVSNYKWPNHPEDCICQTFCKTQWVYKCSQQYILLQLKRFYISEGTPNKYLEQINIPLLLDMTRFHVFAEPMTSLIFHLKGVIVHAGQEITGQEGHYFTILRHPVSKTEEKPQSSIWSVYDDGNVEQSVPMTPERLSQFIDGGPGADLYDNENTLPQSAMILLYAKVL